MRTNQEIVQQVLIRAKKITWQRLRKRGYLLSAATVITGLMLVFVLAVFIPKGVDLPQDAPTVSHTLGALFVSNNAISYIVVGVLAFILGACVVLLSQWLREKEKHNR